MSNEEFIIINASKFARILGKVALHLSQSSQPILENLNRISTKIMPLIQFVGANEEHIENLLNDLYKIISS